MQIMENKLQLIVKESGLETTKSKYILDKFTNYFEIASDWEKKAKEIIVKSADDKTEMQMARVGRLFLREKRIAIEKARVELKEQALREGKAIDGIANILKALIVPIEEYLEKQERFVEIKEAELAEKKRIEEEERIEKERLAQEEADRKEQERIRLENIKLQKEAIEREKKLVEEQERARKEKELADAKLKSEQEANEKIQSDIRAKAEETARLEKEKADKIIAEERAKAETERLEKEKAQKLLDEQIECPFCHKKFNI
jgi:hypothetical protein